MTAHCRRALRTRSCVQRLRVVRIVWLRVPWAVRTVASAGRSKGCRAGFLRFFAIQMTPAELAEERARSKSSPRLTKDSKLEADSAPSYGRVGLVAFGAPTLRATSSMAAGASARALGSLRVRRSHSSIADRHRERGPTPGATAAERGSAAERERHLQSQKMPNGRGLSNAPIKQRTSHTNTASIWNSRGREDGS